MFSFDGQFKSKRVVSLGGASKKYDIQRQSFDSTLQAIEKSKSVAASSSVVKTLLRSLLFFYSHSEDSQRLIWLCQLLLKNRSIVHQLQTEGHSSWLYQIKCLLLICSRSLESSLKDSKPVAIQLRMLEEFTSHQSFNNPGDPVGNRKDAAMVTVYLARNGYFRYLRALLNARVPSSLEPSPSPPTPLAAAIRDLVMNPLQLTKAACNDGENVLNIFSALISDILCPEMTEQMTCFLLPSLAETSSQFPFGFLLESLLILLSKADSSGASNFRVTPSPWLLFGVLAFVDKNLGSTSDLTLLKNYVKVLQILLIQLPHPVSANPDGEDDSDSDSEMETDPLQPSLENLNQKCLDVLDSKEHVKTLESLLTRPKVAYESEVITALCNICHFLMSESRLPIHKTRLLYTLALNPVFVRELWRNVQAVSVFTSTGKEITLLDLISRGRNFSTEEAGLVTPLLSLLSSLLSSALFSVHDNEFYGEEGQRSSFLPFSLGEMERMSSVLCTVAIGIIEIIYPETSPTFTGQYLAAMKSVGAKSALLKRDEFYPREKWIKLLKLHSRDSRRQFCAEGHWLSHKVAIDPAQMSIDGFLNQEDTVDGVIEAGMSSATARNMSILQHIPFVVPFKDRVKLLKAGFDPNIGFFKSTHERLLYPNPQAIYENMLVELPFASFFLCKLLSKQGTNVDIHHLESLDPEMYRFSDIAKLSERDSQMLSTWTGFECGFTQDHPCVMSFWRVVNQFTDTQKRQLLKFVTSCSRPPLLGFKELEPPFCVHSAGPEDRLPTASTCMNLLKLPEYLDDVTMREKLLYAVESGAGFELS
ncbi:Ubiquitin-protein ligase E3C [Acropora cervicornis]|uniref:HECT-type E3 ubiquitin transferase n=1 Tax=Acropora cervicornis TaxID=6130 RepID=A0AAD9QYG8_ACRCE|nr:Ubiquitin-protein ligase E3C [Acropora cervicornis]